MYLLRDEKYNQCYTTLAFFLWRYSQCGVNNTHFFHVAFPSRSACATWAADPFVQNDIPTATKQQLKALDALGGLDVLLPEVAYAPAPTAAPGQSGVRRAVTRPAPGDSVVLGRACRHPETRGTMSAAEARGRAPGKTVTVENGAHPSRPKHPTLSLSRCTLSSTWPST